MIAPDGEVETLLAELAELFVIDVRALTPDRLQAYGEAAGEHAIVPVIFELAVADGIAEE